MTPKEGRVLLLRLLITEPMQLCLFTKGPNRKNDNASRSDFILPKSTQMHALQFRDWLVDEEAIIARADKRTFSFSAAGEKIAGWYLATKKDQVIVGYDYYPEPYPVNSIEDKVAVRPVLALRDVAA
ncbi:MAG: hypothetical protein OEW90_00950 [Betaproteobacteria bacterium]|nr:hypothetical protein [Betaproteobacteria bacterium]MDH4322685.1 hypothetical protein [Betaproteobacteria bacterium]